MNLDTKRFKSPQQACAAAGDFIIQCVINNPQSRITYATGNTMIMVYQHIAQSIQKGEVDFSQTMAYHLDEYHPYAPDAQFSFVKYLYEYVFTPFHLPQSHIHTLNGQASDPHQEATRYDQLIESPVDLCILGIGPGGHIGFNEQGTPFESRTHLAMLCQETIARDTKTRGQDTPPTALTQGIANILESKHIILIAHGTSKADYIAQAFNHPTTTECPASALQTVSDKLTLFFDESAVSQLKT